MVSRIDEKYDYTLSTSGDRWDAKFTTPSGKPFNVSITGSGVVTFDREGSYSQKHDLDTRELAHVTGTIFGILERYAREVQPENISFSAAGRESDPHTKRNEFSSRPGAYAASSNKLAKKLEKERQAGANVKSYDVTYSGNPPHGTTYFTLNRVDDDRPPKILKKTADGEEWQEGDMPKGQSPEERLDLKTRRERGKIRNKIIDQINYQVTHNFIDTYEAASDEEKEELVDVVKDHYESNFGSGVSPRAMERIAPKNMRLKSWAHVLDRFATDGSSFDNLGDEKSDSAKIIRWLGRHNTASEQFVKSILNDEEKYEKYLGAFNRRKELYDKLTSDGITQEIVDAVSNDEKSMNDFIAVSQSLRRKLSIVGAVKKLLPPGLTYTPAYLNNAAEQIATDGSDYGDIGNDQSNMAHLLRYMDGRLADDPAVSSWVEGALGTGAIEDMDAETARDYYIDEFEGDGNYRHDTPAPATPELDQPDNGLSRDTSLPSASTDLPQVGSSGRLTQEQYDSLSQLQIHDAIQAVVRSHGFNQVLDSLEGLRIDPSDLQSMFRALSSGGGDWYKIINYKKPLFKWLWENQPHLRENLSDIVMRWARNNTNDESEHQRLYTDLHNSIIPGSVEEPSEPASLPPNDFYSESEYRAVMDALENGMPGSSLIELLAPPIQRGDSYDEVKEFWEGHYSSMSGNKLRILKTVVDALADLDGPAPEPEPEPEPRIEVPDVIDVPISNIDPEDIQGLPTSSDSNAEPEADPRERQMEIVDHVRGLIGTQGNFSSYSEDWARLSGEDEPFTITHMNGDTSLFLTELEDDGQTLAVNVIQDEVADEAEWAESARKIERKLQRSGYAKDSSDTWRISINDAIGAA